MKKCVSLLFSLSGKRLLGRALGQVDGLGSKEDSGESLPSESRESAKKTILLPPPNVTGHLHMGHALTICLQDSFVRFLTLKSGEKVNYIPGFDHAGLSTQICVERELKKLGGMDGQELNEKFCLEWTEKNQKKMISQMEALNSTLNWSRMYYTLDKELVKDVKDSFKILFEKGLIYRKNRLVNWSPYLKTALSDIETMKISVKGKTLLKTPNGRRAKFGVLYEIAYKLNDPDQKDAEVVVCTTRPETIPGDIALAVHPKDPRYKGYIGKYAQNPISKKSIPIIGDEILVDPEFGSGIVKITPAHDRMDMEFCERQNLPLNPGLFDSDGKYIDDWSDCITKGMDRFKGREEIIKHLGDIGLVRGIKEDHEMTVTVCSKTGDILEPMLKPQWYLKMKDAAQKLLEDVRKGHFLIKPESHVGALESWLDSIQDWCISRQSWWGIRIPIVHAVKKADPSDCSFILDINDDDGLNGKEFCHETLASDDYSFYKDPDVLDTWFSSCLLPITVTKNEFPLEVMETGADILFFWVIRMLLICKMVNPRKEWVFRKIWLHGMVVDGEGRKMSKSVGNVLDPMDFIKGSSLEDLLSKVRDSCLEKSQLKLAEKILVRNFPQGIPVIGTDCFRLGLMLGGDHEGPLRIDLRLFKRSRSLITKYQNMIKFMRDRLDELGFQYVHQGNQVYFKGDPFQFDLHQYLQDFQHQQQYLVELSFILEMRELGQRVTDSYEKYNIHSAACILEYYLFDSLCSKYLEFVKNCFKSQSVKLEKKQFCMVTFWYLAQQLTVLLYPIIPNETKKMYHALNNNSSKMEWQNNILASKMNISRTAVEESKTFRMVLEDLKNKLNGIRTDFEEPLSKTMLIEMDSRAEALSNESMLLDMEMYANCRISQADDKKRVYEDLPQDSLFFTLSSSSSNKQQEIKVSVNVNSKSLKDPRKLSRLHEKYSNQIDNFN